MPARLPPWLRPRGWWWLVAVCAFEFILFDQFGARRHTALYPRWHDQVEYLTDSYTAYEFAQSRGTFAGLLNALTNPAGQGTLHDFLALMVFFVAGPSRSAALAVNMLALMAWQFALFLAVAHVRGSRPLAVAAAMLPLALGGPWQNIPGSAYDFRLDHLALCALGITAAVGVIADGFRSRRGSTAFGVAVGLTIVTRFLTGPYFVLIFAALAVSILAGVDRRRRGLHLLRAALIAGAIAVPILWINYDAVRGHYAISRYLGPHSAIHSQEMGLGRSLSFVVTHLAQRHAGLAFGLIAIGGLIALAALRRPKVAAPTPPASDDTWRMGALFFFAPLVILTLHPQKSEVVVGGLAAGLVTLVTAGWMRAARHVTRVGASIFAATVAMVTLAGFAHAQLTPAYSPAAVSEIRQVNTIADRVVARARAADVRSPRVAVDHITDALDAQVLRVIGYERKHVWVPFAMTLPTGVAEPTDAEVMERVGQSDFVFLSEEAPSGPYPFDRKLAAMRPQLRAWCEANLRRAEGFTLFGRRMVLYQRREIPFP